jgi:serine/threonine protein kinase
MNDPQSTGPFKTQIATSAQDQESIEKSGLRTDSERDPAKRYSLGEVVAEGGMAEIIEGTDLIFQRPVAIKFLKSTHTGSDDFIRRFRAESVITGQLQHPSIVPVHDFGIWPTDGRPFLVMKLIKGNTLKELVDAKPFDTSDLIRSFESICEAIGFAHERGIIHRDLKPENVMVGKYGEVQVMDWGLAKHVDSAWEPTPAPTANLSTIFDPRQHVDNDRTDGKVLGSPSYLAPEMATGDSGQPRTDVFGLGGILCYILTGRPVFLHDKGADCWLQSKSRDLDEVLDRLRSGPDPEWRSLAQDCLAANPVDRPVDGMAVARMAREIRLKNADKAIALQIANAKAETESKHKTQAEEEIHFLLNLLDFDHPVPKSADGKLFWKIVQMADATIERGNVELAHRWFRKAQSIAQSAMTDPKNAQAQRDLSVSFNKLGDVTLQLGRTDEAMEFYRQDLDMSRRLADADPKNAEAQRDLQVSYYKFGTVEQKMESYRAAIDWYEKGLAVAAKFEKPEYLANEVRILKKLIGDCKANLPPPKGREAAPDRVDK